MPEAVDTNPDLDAAVATLRNIADAGEFVYTNDLRLVLDALADYRARRATGGPAPANTHSWGERRLHTGDRPRCGCRVPCGMPGAVWPLHPARQGDPVIGKDDKVTYLSRGFGQPAIRACDRCGSLVAFEDEDTHRTWHHALNTITLALRPAMVTREDT